jgi:[acyl-carrier-protein] S-malonyltransferase
MKSAAEGLAARLQSVKIIAPRIPVIHNVDVLSHSDPLAIRQALVAQLYSPVRWVETIQALAAAGCQEMIECGPGKVLTGLNKRIVESCEYSAVGDSASIEALNLKETLS